MPEWTINIESAPDTTRDEDALERFQTALDGDERAHAPATSLGVDTGQIGATFQVDAPERDEAALVASFAYWQALGRAGLDVNAPSSLIVTGDDERHERFDVRASRSAA
jgi:hypothetical protein